MVAATSDRRVAAEAARPARPGSRTGRADGPPPTNEGVQMRDELSQRQRKILGVIREAVTDRGYPPSIREIGEAVGLTSTSSVHSQLEALERKGFIRRDPTKPRAIEVFTEGAPVEPPRPLPTYVPLLGQIAAGRPILADENVDELMPLPRDLVGTGELFGLHVRGDSMIDAGVLDGERSEERRVGK